MDRSTPLLLLLLLLLRRLHRRRHRHCHRLCWSTRTNSIRNGFSERAIRSVLFAVCVLLLFVLFVCQTDRTFGARCCFGTYEKKGVFGRRRLPVSDGPSERAHRPVGRRTLPSLFRPHCTR